MMMALGDALAIALLERKGFSSADFRLFHPGGRLGRRLLRVRDIMHTKDEIPLVSLGTRMSEAILVMTAKSFGCVGVCDSGRLPDRGHHRRRPASAHGRVAAGAHRSGSHAPQPEDDYGRGSGDGRLGLMNRFAITSLFVVEEDKRPIGFLHMHDCLRAGVA